MQTVADLHIHSRFSRATSKQLDFVALHRAALEKGIGLVGTGDFTHPGWMTEISEQLEPAEDGLFRLRPELARAAEEGLPDACAGEVRFVLQVEISNIYKCGERVRKNHNLVYVPSLDAARVFVATLEAVGNLASDGRPILGLDARDLLEMVLETDPLAFLIPAHIWTPWFSMLGSKSGFDSLEECFRDLAGHVFAAETGLSSDPPMNWRLSALDRLTLVSNSDAHSPARLGREANLVDVELGFEPLHRALATGEGFLGTVEFYPEEGKYHLDGHRKCGLRLEPEQTRELGGRCPSCGGLLTVGVMSRVQELADRPPGRKPEGAAPFVSLVPLAEVLGEVLAVGAGSKKVAAEQSRLQAALGPELEILRTVPLEDVARVGGTVVAEAIRRVRAGELAIAAGYDGEFGTVQVFATGERERLFGQQSFIGAADAPVRAVREQPALRRQTREAPGPATTTSDPLDELDADQRRAVEHGRDPLLVVAGPGTGKTRTLVARIAHQVASGEVDPEQVLAIAFTNQAADELRERIDAQVPGATAEAPLVTTFHALGRRILAEERGAPPRVADEDERWGMVRRALGPDAGRADVDSACSCLSLAKQGCDPSAEMGRWPELEGVLERYADQLAVNGALDLDDLVLEPFRMLASDPEMAAAWAGRFRLVAVDEYQDVNDVQAALVRLLAPGGRGLVAIGDPDQAIYGFRGARPGHFRRFVQTYPGASTVELGTSYRLTRPVAEVAGAVVARPTPLTVSRDGPRVELVDCPSAASEAEQILVRLERIVGGSSHFAVDSGRGADAELTDVGFGDVAVLLRTRAQRDEVLVALGRSGIPCRAVGEDEAHDPRSEKVAVMTMHAAKGREFAVVFAAGVEQGLLPLDHASVTADEAEERRLLYVALTRARKLVVVSWARCRTLWGRRLPGAPSPFLADLPAASTRRVEPELGPKPPPSTQLRLF